MTNPRGALTALAVLLGCGHMALYLGAGPIDDDFICYRYARNLVRGMGLVYQSGERVEGFTNPLWVLLHAVGQWAGIAPILWTRVLGCLGLAAAVLFAESVERHASGRAGRVPLAAIAVALSPAVAFHAAAGLGTTLMGALILGWFSAWLRALERGRAPLAAALLLAAACLLRQEALVFALPFALAVRPRRLGLLPLGALAGWTAFRWVYYGELLPMTYYAKRLPLAQDLAYGWRYLVTSTQVAGIGCFLAVAIWAPLRAARGRAALATAVAGMLLHTIYVVASGGDYLALARFFVPALPLALTLGAIAVGTQPLARAAYGLLCLTFLWTHVRWESEAELAMHTRPYLHLAEDFQEQRWASLGRYFAASVGSERAVCLSPIGAFGWESDLRIVDVLGLTDPAVAHAPADLSITMKGHHRHDASALLDRAPAYVIPGNGVRDPRTGRMAVNPWERDLFQEPRFLTGYEHHIAPIPGGQPLDVWVARGVPGLPGSQRVPAR